MKKNKNYGILASIDWNSNNWRDYPTNNDFENVDYEYVNEKKHTFTYLNFAHDLYNGIKIDEYEALIPHFWKNLPSYEESKNVIVVFIKSLNYKNKKTYIVGFYAFPRFEKLRKQVITNTRNEIIDVNLISQKKDIVYLESPVDISDEIVWKKILPNGKSPGKMKYNYLTNQNVKNILDIIRNQNNQMKELISINGIKKRILDSLPNL